MTTKQIKKGLVIGSATAIVAALAVVAWGLLPVGVSVPAATSGDGSVVDVSNPAAAMRQLPTPQQLSQISTIDLRRPLRDPPPIGPPPLAAKLVGTIYEPANPTMSAAIFKLGDGTQQMYKAGDVFPDPTGEVKVIEVGDKRVKITYRGQERELTHDLP